MKIGSIFDHLYVWLVLLVGLLFFCQISRAESARHSAAEAIEGAVLAKEAA